MAVSVGRESRVRLVGLSLGVSIVGILTGGLVLLAMALTLSAAGVTIDGPTQLVLSLVAVQGIAFPVTGIAYLRWRGHSLDFIPIRIPSVREVGTILAGWIGALVLVNAATYIVSVVGADAARNQAGQIALENPEFIPFLIPLVFLLNAPGEELLYRGVIQGTLRERFSGPVAILLASLMFAPIHIVALIGSLQAALTTIAILLVPSLVFGAVYEITENFLVPTLVHGLYNATLFGLLYLTVTMGGPDSSPALLALTG
ncbi:MAG: lysostaphin resistance A-like protein [Halobacteriaceae archaeon]